MTENTTIGRRIRARRRRLYLSQGELGRRIGIHGNAICLLEQGIGNLSGYLAGIAEALGVEESWLVAAGGVKEQSS